MDVLFENRFEHDREYLKEYFFGIYFMSPIYIAMNSFIIGACVLALFSFRIFGRATADAAALYVCCALYFLLVFYRFFSSVKRELAAQKEKYKGEVGKAKVLIREDGLDDYFTNSDFEMHVEFSKVTHVVVTKNYFFITTKAKMQFPLKKDGFVVGDAQSFLEFLKGKGIRTTRVFK